MSVSARQRFTKQHPCPVCGGYDQAPRGEGERCFGFLSDDGQYAHCTREDDVSGLTMEQDSLTYAHKLAGPCRCGRQHGPEERAAGKPKIAALYDYRDGSGTLRFQVVRLEPKAFRQRRPDGAGGWVWNLTDVDRVLYRLPELLAEPSRLVFLTEGEKDADALAGLGLLATCNAGGAGKWHGNYSAALAGRYVAILPDQDEPGKRHADIVAHALAGIAASVRVVTLPDLPEHGDVSDWLAAGGTRVALERLVKAAPEWTAAKTPKPSAVSIINAADLASMTFPEPKWSVPGILPEGYVLLAGKPKVGKSWLVLALAVAVASGGRALGSVQVEAGDVLYLALEDHPRRLQERLCKIGDAWPERLHLVTVWSRLGAGGIEALEAWLTAHSQARLVIIDTLARVRLPHSRNGDAYAEDYAVGETIKKLADQYSVCILVIHHRRKMDAEDPFDTVSGTNGLTGSADATLVLQRDRSTPTATLHVTGRDVEEQTLALAWDAGACGWSLTTHEQASGQRLIAELRKLGGKAERWTLQNARHWTAGELDTAIAGAGPAVRVFDAPRADGRKGRPTKWLALCDAQYISDISDVWSVSSGTSGPNVAKTGPNVADFGPNVASRNGHIPSGSGPNVANVANVVGLPAGGRVREVL